MRKISVSAQKISGTSEGPLSLNYLEVNPELDSIRTQRGRARSALFSRVVLKTAKKNSEHNKLSQTVPGSKTLTNVMYIIVSFKRKQGILNDLVRTVQGLH